MNSSKLNLWINIIPLLIAVLMVLFFLIFGKILPPKLPLLYSLPWGDNQLVTPEKILIIPLSIITISLFNIFFSAQLHPAQIFFKRALILTSAITTLILTITFFKIIMIFI